MNEIPRGPRAVVVERATAASRVFLVVAAGVVAALALLPYWGGGGAMRVVGEFACAMALTQLWNLLAGYAGLVSVGQQAFVGLGGYALVFLTVFAHVPPLLAVPLAGVVAAAFAVPTAFLVFRLRGAYFAIGTWVVAEVYRLSFAQVAALGGGSGMSLPLGVVREIAPGVAGRTMLIYWMALAACVLVTAMVYALLCSRQGLALSAIRDSERAAESLGVDGTSAKLTVYVLVAFATGMVGAVVVLQKLRISPDAAFSVTDWTAFVIFMVVIGGVGTVEGPIVGALVFFLLRGFLADLGAWYLILLGAVAIGVMLFAPHGIWGALARRFDVHPLPVRRRLPPPRDGARG